METGRVKDTIKKRAIYKKIKKCCPEIISKQGVSQTTLLRTDKTALVSFVTDTVTVPIRLLEKSYDDYIIVQVDDILNRLYADGARPLSMAAVVMLPQETKEAALRFLMDCFGQISEKRQIEISDVKAECTPDVKQAIIMLTVVGNKENVCEKTELFLPETEIVMAQTAALEGTIMLEHGGRKLLETRFSKRFLENVRMLSEQCNAGKLIEIIEKEVPKSLIYSLERSGVFGALWEISLISKKGFLVDLKKIPILQETIEICEFFDINPYMLRSGGALFIAAKPGKGEALAESLKRQKIPAAVIGVMLNNADKVIRNGEECRYLDMPMAVKTGQNIPEGMDFIY